MMNKSFITIAWVLMYLTSCSSTKKDDLISYSLENVSAINVDAAYPLDSLVKKMDVIPLETTDSCLFDDVALLEESEDYFFIYSEKTSQLYRFAKDGNNMKTISGKGQGPQEYLSIKRMMLDNESKELYIMDYLGRKMKIFSFDGEYLRSLPLPEDFAYTNCFLSLKEKAIYYVSSYNSVQMDFLKYDLDTSEFIAYSHREREMDKGEFFIGQTLFCDTEDYPLVYHYFNDTVFQVTPEGLSPHHLLKLGERASSFDDFKADAFTNPRPQYHKIQVWGMEIVKNKVCIFYSLSRFKKERGSAPLMAVYTLGEKTLVPHVNWISEQFLSIEQGERFHVGYQRTSLLRSCFPESLEEEFRRKYKIHEDDNPIILKYHLK